MEIVMFHFFSDWAVPIPETNWLRFGVSKSDTANAHIGFELPEMGEKQHSSDGLGKRSDLQWPATNHVPTFKIIQLCSWPMIGRDTTARMIRPI